MELTWTGSDIVREVEFAEASATPGASATPAVLPMTGGQRGHTDTLRFEAVLGLAVTFAVFVVTAIVFLKRHLTRTLNL
jgi:hypothetical protein